VVLNGVDVTDFRRPFSKEEWDKIRDYWQYIWDKRAGKSDVKVPHQAGGQDNSNLDAASVQARSIQALRQVSSIITELTNAMVPVEVPVGVEVTADAGNSFGEASYGSRRPQVQFDPRLPQGRGGPRNMSAVKTSERRKGVSVGKVEGLVKESQVGTCELDNHADTCCLGSNFVPIKFTGKVCDVAPFLDDTPSHEGIQICSGATAFEDDKGEIWILVVHEAIWFGDKMKHSLINPNQVRASGILLCDDPTDPYRHLGMKTQDFFVPFIMKGTICSFTTRTPTSWELDNCPRLELTSEDKWDPHQVCFLQASGDTPGGFMKSVGGQVLKGFKDHKVIYGSSTPRSVKDALKLDDVTGSNCWREDIEEELERVRLNFVQVTKRSLVKTNFWYHLVRSSQFFVTR